MKSLAQLLGGVAFAAMISMPAAADDKATVDYRINIMKSMGAQAAGLGAAMQGKVPGDNIGLHARMIALGMKQAIKGFEPKLVGGTAKGEIWDNCMDFSDRLKSLEAAAIVVADLADKGDAAGAQGKIKEMLTCKSCHDVYRVPEEKK
jgi:cytochrome c556